MLTIAYIALYGLIALLTIVVLLALVAFGIDRANKDIFKDRNQ